MRRSHVLMLVAAAFAVGAVVGRGRRDTSAPVDDESCQLNGLRVSEVDRPDRIMISKIIGPDEQIHPQWRWTTLRPYSLNRGDKTKRFYTPEDGARRWQLLIGGVVLCCEEISSPDERAAPADIRLP